MILEFHIPSTAYCHFRTSVLYYYANFLNISLRIQLYKYDLHCALKSVDITYIGLFGSLG